jgi:hypothetical protein
MYTCISTVQSLKDTCIGWIFFEVTECTKYGPCDRENRQFYNESDAAPPVTIADTGKKR